MVLLLLLRLLLLEGRGGGSGRLWRHQDLNLKVQCINLKQEQTLFKDLRRQLKKKDETKQEESPLKCFFLKEAECSMDPTPKRNLV